MREIEWRLDIGLNAQQTGTWEVEDNATDEEIDNDIEEIVKQYINWSWKEKY